MEISFEFPNLTIGSGGIQPTGKKNISNLLETDVSTYATAQVVDENITAENIKKDVEILGVTGTYGGDAPKYLSLERNGEYLYTITFDELPQANDTLSSALGACSSFVRDGKLYRNLDWKYNNNLSFRVITEDFDGMAFIEGLTTGNLDDELLEQLPYCVCDGVNRNGIMVATHVLYNDWGWSNAGSISLTRLPFEVLSNVESMATIQTDLSDILNNLCVPAEMAGAEYLLQVIVSDGETTYVLAPPETSTGSYELINITSNPKLTNFRWVSNPQVVRTNLQNRPTGVERWNEIASNTTLEDLRFTKAYEAPTRLSEFIGLGETTKDSTDTELTELYNTAKAIYDERTRDGRT